MSKKVIVFDFDETLGSFSQLYQFWYFIKMFFNNNLTDEHFYSILDDNILFFRPNILNIFNILKYKKQKKICSHVIIYTNNNAPFFWVELIKNYLNKKMNYIVIDQIIRAYKIDNKIVECCRNTNEKTLDDFINCTKLSKNTKICFFDDKIHNNMIHKNVLYINLEPYVFNEKINVLIKKFYISNLSLFKTCKKNYNVFFHFIISNIKDYNKNYQYKSNTQKNIEFILSKQIIKILNKFLFKKNITRKFLHMK